MHNTATTSREHYKRLDASGLHMLIINKMRENVEREWCIADLAAELNLERSTVSGRMNELRTYGQLEFTGQKYSNATGIKANHYRLITQPTLI